MEMKSMKKQPGSDGEMQNSGCMIEGMKEPMYPYGLQIDLCDESLQMLGLTELPQVGQKVMVQALAEVQRVSKTSCKDGDGEESEMSMCLQITDMGMGKPEEPKPSKKPEELFYSQSGE